MTKSDSNPRKSSTINKHISDAENEITELEQRKDKLNAQIQSIQDNILDLSENEAQKELGALTSTREVTAGAIQDRHQRIETLQVELAKAKEIEANEARFKELVELTKKAHKMMNKHDKVVRWFNEHLEEKLIEYADIISSWKKVARQFKKNTKAMEPSFNIGFKIDHDSGDDLHKKRQIHKSAREELIAEIEEKAGVDTRPASRSWGSDHWIGGRNFNLEDLENANFNLTKLTEGPQRRRKRKLEAKQEQAKRDKEAAE
jgi:small-conductance mechanosensitive channel